MDTINTGFGEQIKKVCALTRVSTHVTADNVYQEGQDDIRLIMDQMMETLLLPGSGVQGLENLEDIFSKAQEGKSCLLLTEHYSNFDLSIISYLIRKAGGRGTDISDALVAIAGMKLNEDNPAVAAFASAYSRIVICPSRSLQDLDAEKNRDEIIRLNSINRAAMKALTEVKTKGKLILVFPTGTRYRPWDPSTKKGVREIDSYVRSFDYMCCIALNGQLLHVQQTDMLNDFLSHDVVFVTASPVYSCEEFRDKSRAAAEASGIEDKKQAAVDAIMLELEKLHDATEEKRQKLLNK